MKLSGILFAGVGLPVLLLLWCVLQIYNTKQRQTAAPPPPAKDEICRPVTIASLRADMDKEGTTRYFAAFTSRTDGRFELLVPAADYVGMAAGNTGDLVTRAGQFVRFTQTY